MELLISLIGIDNVKFLDYNRKKSARAKRHCNSMNKIFSLLKSIGLKENV